MTAQFHEGQEVEVYTPYRFIDSGPRSGDWRKAKIVEFLGMSCWQIQFPDGTRSVFDAEHIRAVIYRPSGGANDSFQSDYECCNGDCE